MIADSVVSEPLKWNWKPQYDTLAFNDKTPI